MKSVTFFSNAEGKKTRTVIDLHSISMINVEEETLDLTVYFYGHPVAFKTTLNDVDACDAIVRAFEGRDLAAQQPVQDMSTIMGEEEAQNVVGNG